MILTTSVSHCRRVGRLVALVDVRLQRSHRRSFQTRRRCAVRSATSNATSWRSSATRSSVWRLSTSWPPCRSLRVRTAPTRPSRCSSTSSPTPSLSTCSPPKTAQPELRTGSSFSPSIQRGTSHFASVTFTCNIFCMKNRMQFFSYAVVFIPATLNVDISRHTHPAKYSSTFC